jgi:hypothetical protein
MAALSLVCTLAARAADPETPPAPEPKQKWDVNHPPGTPATVAIDTRSGTWMSVDVSPDGQRILFDLLGDLYELPIAGGEARPSPIRSPGRCRRVIRPTASTSPISATRPGRQRLDDERRRQRRRMR